MYYEKYIFKLRIYVSSDLSDGIVFTNIGKKAHAGNPTQSIHPPLIQKTRIHTCLVKNIREQSKGEDMSNLQLGA